MKVHVVIPARMASTRLPNKPLADIAGVPMIVRVASQARRSQADTVVVAVDDERVARVVAAAGYDAALTAVDHASGSDRVMEVVHKRGWQTDDIVINVQGDEPLLPPALIDQLAKAMQDDPSVERGVLNRSRSLHPGDGARRVPQAPAGLAVLSAGIGYRQPGAEDRPRWCLSYQFEERDRCQIIA